MRKFKNKLKIMYYIGKAYLFNDTRFWQLMQFLEQESKRQHGGDLFNTNDATSLNCLRRTLKTM